MVSRAKSIRRSFEASILVLLLCIVALIGATTAWFTSTASNTGNRIQAGVLQIDLLMDTTAAASQQPGDYVSIANGQGDIFKQAAEATNSNATLWEPGKTQVVYLAVQNKGSLALKYNIAVDVTDGGLASALEYAILNVKSNDPNFGANKLSGKKWQDLTAAAGEENTGNVTEGRTIAAENGVMDEIANGTLNETQYFALAVHMKETAGNEYQNKSIEIDVSVNAAQYNVENDGFGSSTYDALAQLPVSVSSEPVTGEVTSDLSLKTYGDITKAVVPKKAVNSIFKSMKTEGADSNSLVLSLNATKQGQKETSDTTIIDLNIGMDAAMRSEEDSVVTTSARTIDEIPIGYARIDIQLIKGLTNVEVKHNGQTMQKLEGPSSAISDEYKNIGGYHYKPSTGVLTIRTKTFDLFSISYDSMEARINEATWYATMKSAVAAAKDGDKIELMKDIEIDTDIIATKYIDINLGGHTITSSTHGIVINGHVSSITNGTINSEDSSILMGRDAEAQLDTLNINATSTVYYPIYLYDKNKATIGNITGGVYTAATESDSEGNISPRAALVVIGDSGTVNTISGGTFQGVGKAVKNNGTIENVTGGTFCESILHKKKDQQGTDKWWTYGKRTDWQQIWTGNAPESITGGVWAFGPATGLKTDDGYQYKKLDIEIEFKKLATEIEPFDPLVDRAFYPSSMYSSANPTNLADTTYYWYSVVPVED